jgi:hypothetical protein
MADGLLPTHAGLKVIGHESGWLELLSGVTEKNHLYIPLDALISFDLLLVGYKHLNRSKPR